MVDSPNLTLPYIAGNQDQKHVTHNEALRALDVVVQLTVADRDLTAPPGSPNDGDRYMPASGATGDWSTWDLNIAAYQDGAWVKYVPQEGWLCWVEDEGVLLIYTGSAWLEIGGAAASMIVARTDNDAQMQFAMLEEELTGLSGATVDSSIQIPNGAIVFNVSERVTTTVTGATSFDVGTASEASKFGGTLGLSAGSTNLGVIGPTAFYADTPIRLTANGSNFTGGAVRIAIHYYMPQAPQS